MNGAILPGSLSPGLHVVILAAGFSSRLGRPKALTRVRSSTLLRRTLALVASFSPARIVVVLPPRAARYRLEARGLKVAFAANPARAAGLSSSVRRGIALARYSPARADFAGRSGRSEPAGRGPADFTLARRPGAVWLRDASDGKAAHPRAALRSFYRTGSYARALAVTGDKGLRELVSGLPAQQRALLDLPSAAFDVDTPADLRIARRRLRRGGINP